MKSRFYVTLGLVWILLAVGASIPYLMPQMLATPPVVAASNPRPVVAEEPVITGKPVRISFPRLNIDVPVVPGSYDQSSGNWSVSRDKANFATVTTEPNNKTGRTFIYGHNRWQVFTALIYAQPGDQAVVTTDNGHTFSYALRSIADTDPSDVSYLGPSEEPILTVQTCSGIHYEKRRMLTFELKEVR